MAKCAISPYGHPSGKIGNLVFYMLKGQPICRLIGKPGAPSVKQLANRQAMSVVMQLIKPMADFINVSFKQEANGTIRNPHNLAISYNKKQALMGEYPNIKVDYEKVVLSNGSLEMAKDLKMSKGEKGLNLSWSSEVEVNAAPDDLLMVMVSHPTKNKASTFLNAAKRADGACFLPLEKEWMIDEQMEVYVCFKSANEKSISDSAYLGNINGLPETESEKAEKANYRTVKARFDHVAEDYHQKKIGLENGVLGTKAFRQLKKEYEVLKDKLEHLPGKPS